MKWKQNEKKICSNISKFVAFDLLLPFFSLVRSFFLYTWSSLINVHNISLKFYTYARMNFHRISTLYSIQCCMNLRYAYIQLTVLKIGNKNRAWYVPCDSWLQTESVFHFVWIKRVKIFTVLCALLCHRTHKLLSVHNIVGRHAKIIPLTSFALSNCYTECGGCTA